LPSILVVDDDCPTLDSVTRTLTDQGHAVRWAQSSVYGLALLSQQEFDIVILEVLMAGKEGVETIVEIRRRWPTASVIAMTAGGALVSARQALGLARAVGAAEVLPKPFSTTDLLMTMERVLAGRVV